MSNEIPVPDCAITAIEDACANLVIDSAIKHANHKTFDIQSIAPCLEESLYIITDTRNDVPVVYLIHVRLDRGRSLIARMSRYKGYSDTPLPDIWVDMKTETAKKNANDTEEAWRKFIIGVNKAFNALFTDPPTEG